MTLDLDLDLVQVVFGDFEDPRLVHQLSRLCMTLQAATIYVHHPQTSTTMPAALSRPTTLNFITGNANKLAEVKAILALDDGTGSKKVELQSRSLDLPELQGSIEEISRDKAKRAAVLVCLSRTLVSCVSCLLDVMYHVCARIGADARGA